MASLLDYCTSARQREVISLYLQHHSSAVVSQKLGDCSPRNVRNMVYKIKKRAAESGYTEYNDATRYVPPGHILKGQSTYTKDEQGNPVWYKTVESKRTRKEILQEVTEVVSDAKIKPLPLRKPPNTVEKNLCNEFCITDFHIGAYSWGPETGNDWDMDIAEQTFLNAFSDMVAGVPRAEQAIFLQLGDFLHWDGLLPVTPTSKHIIDADTRYPLLVNIAVSVCIHAVELLLRTHNKVHVICAEGNHDIASSVWLRAIMKIVFSKNKRVTIEDSPFPFYGFSWGDCFLGYHHGHLVKMQDMPGKFFSEPRFRKDMGKANHIHMKCGHIHKQERMDINGCIVERLPTLNARDAYGARGFSYSQRAAPAITYDKKLGEISRKIVYPRYKNESEKK